MLKLFTHSFGLRQLDKIPTNVEQKFGSIVNTFSKQITRQCYSQMAAEPKAENKVTNHIPFLEKVEKRKEQASRSIIVEVKSKKSYKELYTYCNSVGTVNKMFHYSRGIIEPKHYIIVEFADESGLRQILSNSVFNQECIGLTTTHFLYFNKVANRKLSKSIQNGDAKLDMEDSTAFLNETDLKKCLQECRDISDQISTLYNSTKLTDVGTRLRFLTVMQLETCLSGLFANSKVYPFGSSVNGFGKINCDLDLVLRLNLKQNSNGSVLVFHSMSSAALDRSMTQKYMDTLGGIFQLFLPGCIQVRRILQARVPIIKFHQQYTDVECDFSMANMSGVYMADFLYMMGEIDERVRPLVFAIRSWAKEVGITNSSPGRWISNFSLSLLVLAFLQKPLRSPPILPSLNTLVKLAGPSDKYITEDEKDCTFLRDLNKYHRPTNNKESLSSLLTEFFEFYSQFDFSKNAISLNEAVSIRKPTFNPMYIVNPLEKELNVSQNVSLEEVTRFKIETNNAAHLLQSQENNGNWGLLGLLQNRNKKHAAMALASITKQERLMDVTTLFEHNEDEKNNIEFKNNDVKKQVNEIRRNTKNLIKNITR